MEAEAIAINGRLWKTFIWLLWVRKTSLSYSNITNIRILKTNWNISLMAANSCWFDSPLRNSQRKQQFGLCLSKNVRRDGTHKNTSYSKLKADVARIYYLTTISALVTQWLPPAPGAAQPLRSPCSHLTLFPNVRNVWHLLPPWQPTRFCHLMGSSQGLLTSLLDSLLSNKVRNTFLST